MPNSKIKVSSYTQVEPEFVDGSADIRSIIGQENGDEVYLSNRLQEINLREESKGIRPPLVGQASSSSNDSVSLPFERKVSDLESRHTGKNSPANQARTETFSNPSVEVEQSNLNLIRSTYVSTPYMFTRDDFMSQRPPEGSSEQLGTAIQPSDSFDFPRVRSSSSVSSVASGRPLEWDSGADVGYNQICNIGKTDDPGMSTIERIALGCGTNLLTRSDPEGTTGPSRQPPTAVYKTISSNNHGRPYNKIGIPNAESTPVGTCITSSGSPDNVSEGVISPIVYGDTNKVLKDRDIYPSSASEGDRFENKTLLPSISHKPKIPLFPEIINSLPLLSTQEAQNQSEFVPNNVNQGSVQLRKEDFEVKNTKTGIRNDKTELLDFNFKLKQQLSYIPHESNAVYDCENKKLSSSLENIHLIKDTSEGQTHSKTLPRSQSQVALYTDMLVHENIETTNSIKIPKYNMALHSLVQYNKSASSSSISTVVHRRNSPKHMFVQTSVLKQESVGVQVSEGNYSTRPGFAIETEANDTPHLRKFTTVDHYPQKSNYFHFDSNNEKHNSLPKDVNAAKRNKSNEPMVHSHDGVLCKGAHKKVSCSEKMNRQPSEHVNSDFGFMPSNCHVASNIHIDESHSPVHDTYETNNKKSSFCANTMDSVASSAKSGCWTDKQSSVTVEDRVNSFEYLPGPVYENNERQQIIDSRGTSSVSLHDQMSNNETPDEQCKTWDSSASVSSTLEKDVQRGVEIISDFVKGSCANNTVMKKRLIRRVVEKLISKNYSDDKLEPVELQNNMPWVPSKPPHPIERNGRETRRSVNRSKVPCEFSSRSEKSGSTNLSSECFIPRPAASSTFLPSSLRDNSCLTGKESNSCTTEPTPENTPKNRKPPHAVDVNVKILENGSVSKEFMDSHSSKQSRSRNHRGLSAKTEKLTEEKLKRSSSSGRSDSGVLAQYLSMEREIQLFSICSEIERLGNLKELLEKQEDLKRGIKVLKSRQRSPKKSVLKDRNINRYVGGKAESRIPEEMRKVHCSKSQDLHKPTLSSWLEEVMADSKSNSTVPSAVSSNDLEGWTSHHYKNENDQNIKSCMKRKSNNKVQKSNKGVCSEDKQSKAIYDEPYRGRTEGVKQPKYPSTPYCPRGKTHLDDSIFITDKGITKKNVETETLDTVGVQTSDSIQQLPVVHPNWFRHKHKQFQNCGNRSKTHEEKKKAPIGYCITFEPSPRLPDKLVNEPQPLKEVRIPVPMSEPKQRPQRRLRAGVDRQECENREVRMGSDSDTETPASQSDSDKQPISKVGSGELQYYLLRNRPSYVSRAEDRRRCIAQMQYLRELRDHSKRRLLSLTEPQTAPLPPPDVKRVFSQQTMRRQTERKYRQLSEVRERQQDTKRKESYRTNRLMAEIFKKKLQKRVLKGEVNLSNSVSVISSL